MVALGEFTITKTMQNEEKLNLKPILGDTQQHVSIVLSIAIRIIKKNNLNKYFMITTVLS